MANWGAMNLPDDWGCYYRTCDRCGTRYHASEGGCECEDEEEEESVFTTKIVTARKARFVGRPGEIRKGDTVKVTSGFTYKVGGPRTGYFVPSYTRMVKGPAWATC